MPTLFALYEQHDNKATRQKRNNTKKEFAGNDIV